jgi:tetratricopeptide (TPR) repeat protein
MKKVSVSILFVLFVSISFGQYQIAITEAGEKVILKPNGSWEYLKEKVCSSFNLENYDLAKNKIIKGQSYNFYYNKACQYVNQDGEKSYDAVVNFEEAINLYPTNGGVYSDLGNCYRGGFKCFDNAELYYTKAIENGFTKGFVYYNRAICKFELNKLEEMKMDLDTSRELGWYNDYYKLSEK